MLVCCLFNGLILKKKGKLITWNHRKILSLVVYRLQDSPYFCIFKIQVHTSSQTKGLERRWKQRARLRRDAKFFSLASQALRFVLKTLMPRFTDFFTDFEKKPTVLHSKWSTVKKKLKKGLYYIFTCTYVLWLAQRWKINGSHIQTFFQLIDDWLSEQANLLFPIISIMKCQLIPNTTQGCALRKI